MRVRTFAVFVVLLVGLSAVGQETASNLATPIASTPAAVPRLMQFSGLAKDTDGKPLTGTVGVTFLLYQNEQGGAPLWMETQNVQADAKGHYTVLLGATKSQGLPTDIFSSNEARWLGVQIQGQNEQPRVLLVSTPYALKAADAETLGGKPLSAFQLVAPQGMSGGAVKTPSPADQANEIRCSGGTACKKGFIPTFASNGGSATVNDSLVSQSGTTVSVTGNVALTGNLNASSGEVIGQTGSFTANTSGAALSVGNQNASGIAVSGVNTNTNGGGVGVQGKGPNGVVGNGTTRGVTGEGGTIGVEGDASSSNGIGVSGNGFSGVNGTGLGNNSTGVSGTGDFAGVSGVSTGTVGSDAGVLGQATATSGGASGVLGLSKSGIGVLGNSLATGGTTYGVQGVTNNASGVSAGVEGQNFATSGTTWGIVGASHSPNGIGAIALGDGESKTGFGLIGCCPIGVWGDTASNLGGAAGLAGTADDGQALFLGNNSTGHLTANINNFENSTHDVAIVNFQGAFGFCNTNTDGVLFCSGGHALVVPVDNSQRHVALHAVESPQNWFEDFGSGRLAGGVGKVALDPTFAQTVDANSDYHVFLTPEGDCHGLYVSNKSAAGFEVHELGSGRSNVTFSYRIVALRRGYENLRLEDQTAMMVMLKENQPKLLAKPGAPVLQEVEPKLPVMPAKPNIAAPAKLTARR